MENWFDLIRESDIAALLRIVGEVTELPPDKMVRRRHVLNALLNLIGGRSAVAMEMALAEEGPLARAGTIIKINMSSDGEARFAEAFIGHDVGKPFDVGHSLYYRLALPDGCDFCIGLERCPADPCFTQRERAVVHFLHCHAPHVYHVRPPASGELDQLAPRLRPVMRYLMQGDAEKQIAFKMRLSPHTVHRYTQVIYRQMQVSSRGELLAKCAHWA